MSSHVKIKTHNVLTTEVSIENIELFNEVLQFMLGEIKYGELVTATTIAWTFYGDTFRNCIATNSSPLSDKAHNIIFDIRHHVTYWQTDKFLLRVPKEQANE